MTTRRRSTRGPSSAPSAAVWSWPASRSARRRSRPLWRARRARSRPAQSRGAFAAAPRLRLGADAHGRRARGGSRARTSRADARLRARDPPRPAQRSPRGALPSDEALRGRPARPRTRAWARRVSEPLAGKTLGPGAGRDGRGGGAEGRGARADVIRDSARPRARPARGARPPARGERPRPRGRLRPSAPSRDPGHARLHKHTAARGDAPHGVAPQLRARRAGRRSGPGRRREAARHRGRRPRRLPDRAPTRRPPVLSDTPGITVLPHFGGLHPTRDELVAASSWRTSGGYSTVRRSSTSSTARAATERRRGSEPCSAHTRYPGACSARSHRMRRTCRTDAVNILSIQSSVVYGRMDFAVAVRVLERLGHRRLAARHRRLLEPSSARRVRGRIVPAAEVAALVEGLLAAAVSSAAATRSSRATWAIPRRRGGRGRGRADARPMRAPSTAAIPSSARWGAACTCKPDSGGHPRPSRPAGGRRHAQPVRAGASPPRRGAHDARRGWPRRGRPDRPGGPGLVVATGLRLTEAPGELGVLAATREEAWLVRTTGRCGWGTGDAFAALFLGVYLGGAMPGRARARGRPAPSRRPSMRTSCPWCAPRTLAVRRRASPRSASVICAAPRLWSSSETASSI